VKDDKNIASNLIENYLHETDDKTAKNLLAYAMLAMKHCDGKCKDLFIMMLQAEDVGGRK
jgi:hypothetical protein